MPTFQDLWMYHNGREHHEIHRVPTLSDFPLALKLNIRSQDP